MHTRHLWSKNCVIEYPVQFKRIMALEQGRAPLYTCSKLINSYVKKSFGGLLSNLLEKTSSSGNYAAINSLRSASLITSERFVAISPQSWMWEVVSCVLFFQRVDVLTLVSTLTDLWWIHKNRFLSNRCAHVPNRGHGSKKLTQLKKGHQIWG